MATTWPCCGHSEVVLKREGAATLRKEVEHAGLAFDTEALGVGVRYQFVNVRAALWSNMTEPAGYYGKKRP
jgi:hypothetical protein